MAKRIVGMMVVGPGEADRWLPEVLEQRKALVDDMVIATNNATEKEKKVIKKSGFWQYEDNREWGIHQPSIKQDLLAKVARLRPDWVLPSDADELYDRHFTRDEANRLAETGALGYYFAIVNLWNDEAHYRHDLSFWNIRFFRYEPTLSTAFARKNVHCGLAPAVVYNYGCHAPFLVKHYGLMRPEDREKKVERYNKYDPKAVFKGREFYDKLKTNDYVRPFDEEDFHQKVVRDVADNCKGEEKLWLHSSTTNTQTQRQVIR